MAGGGLGTRGPPLCPSAPLCLPRRGAGGCGGIKTGPREGGPPTLHRHLPSHEGPRGRSAAAARRAGHLGAALVRREAAGEDSEPVTAEDFLTRHFQTFSDFMTRELPQKLRTEELRSQAEQYLDRANKQLEPLARELRTNVLGLFSSLLQLGKGEEQAETP
ncbi:apolipoprotein A-II isoform 1-T2 [Cyanocitta cristata]